MTGSLNTMASAESGTRKRMRPFKVVIQGAVERVGFALRMQVREQRKGCNPSGAADQNLREPHQCPCIREPGDGCRRQIRSEPADDPFVSDVKRESEHDWNAQLHKQPKARMIHIEIGSEMRPDAPGAEELKHEESSRRRPRALRLRIRRRRSAVKAAIRPR